MAFEMIEHLCGKDTDKWQEVEAIAKQALDARIELWDGIEHEIELLTNTTANS